MLAILFTFFVGFSFAKVVEVINQDTFETNCIKKPLCLVAILPDILDTGAKGRNDYIKILKSVEDKNKKAPIGLVWAAAGQQPTIEKVLELGGSGYPALVALNQKKVYSYTGPFIENRVSEFLDQVVKRSAVGRQLDDYPEAEFIDAWDGKDGTRSGADDDDDILAELRKQREKQEADTEAVNYYASSGSKKYKNKKNAKKKKSHDDDL